jgi:hypothetical protein
METRINPEKWHRRHFRAGGGDAEIHYAVFGDFQYPLNVGLAEFRSAFLCDHITLTSYVSNRHGGVLTTLHDGWLGESLRLDDPELYEAVENATSCVLLRGCLPDPMSLLYMRDTVDVLTALMANGGSAILDIEAFAWFSKKTWQDRICSSSTLLPTNHVSVIQAPEEDESLVWLYTRGMRKFGRPDLSYHNVAQQYVLLALELFGYQIQRLAFGAQIADGDEIHISGLPKDLVFQIEDDYVPEFNNLRAEIVPAAFLR